MSLKERTDKLFHKPSDKNQSKIFVQLMEYFHWSWEDLMNLPIPSYLQIVQDVQEIEKEKEKQMKRKK